MTAANRRTMPRALQPTEPVGCRLAPGMITLLEDEIKEGLKRRGIESRFAQFASYAARTLDNTADGRSWSELSGNCRLSWYDKLYRNPLKATAEAEQFTRKLHQAVLASHSGLGRVLDMAAEKLDLKTPKTQPPVQAGIAGRSLECGQAGRDGGEDGLSGRPCASHSCRTQRVAARTLPSADRTEPGLDTRCRIVGADAVCWTCWRKWTVPPCTLPPALLCP